MDFNINLDGHEMLRRACMVAASDDYNLITALALEAEANELLHSGLDDGQQLILDDLRAAGIIE